LRRTGFTELEIQQAYVDGEEDLLAIPAILESPDNALIVYGQPSQGVVVVTASSEVKHETREMMNRMTEV